MKQIVGGVAAAERHCSIWVLVGNRLRARRSDLGLATESVAKALGVEPNVYERYEAGSEQAPALLLAEMAQLFGVPLVWLFQDATPFDAYEEAQSSAIPGSAPVYRIATLEERVEFMVDWFRKLDFEGQQHLLAIAAALSEGNRKLAVEVLQCRAKVPTLRAAPRRVQRNSSLQNSPRKSK